MCSIHNDFGETSVGLIYGMRYMTIGLVHHGCHYETVFKYKCNLSLDLL
jgi:hypothetical protein